MAHLWSGRFAGDPDAERLYQAPRRTVLAEYVATLDRLRLDEEAAFDLEFAKPHQSNISNSGMGSTKRPPHSPICAICATISRFRFHGRIRT